MTTPIEKLRGLGYELPSAKPALANYVPVTRVGDILYISGQLASSAEGVIEGRLGDTMNVVQGANAAELAATNVLAQIVHAAGVDLAKVKRVVKLNVFVCSAADFSEQHLVADGASNLIATVLGDSGKHARSAVGVAALPQGAAVEIDAIIEVAG